MYNFRLDTSNHEEVEGGYELRQRSIKQKWFTITSFFGDDVLMFLTALDIEKLLNHHIAKSELLSLLETFDGNTAQIMNSDSGVCTDYY